MWQLCTPKRFIVVGNSTNMHPLRTYKVQNCPFEGTALVTSFAKEFDSGCDL